MGVSIHSHAVIGVKLPKPPFIKGQAPGCEHNVEEDTAFCPHCGKPAWEECEVPMRGYEPDDEKLCGFDVVLGENNDGPTYYVGIVTASNPYGEFDGYSAININWSLPGIRDTLRKALRPLGLWKDENFGLWTILVYC